MKKAGMIIVLCWLLCLSVSAQTRQSANIEEQYSATGLEEVYEELSGEIKDTLSDWGIDPEGLFAGEGLNFTGVINTLWDMIAQSVGNPLSAFGMGVAILLLCGLLEAISPGGDQTVHQTTDFFAGLCMIVAYMVPAGYTLSKTASVLEGVGVFMLAFVPVYAGLLLLSGHTVTAGGACTLVFGTCQVLVYAAKTFLVPLVGMFQALAVSESSVSGIKTAGFTACVKKVSTWSLGILITVFTGVLSLTGIINAAGDSLAQRTTRYFIGNMIPVIGGAISDSMATLQGCFSLLKTGGGILGLGVIAVMVLPVVLEILLWRFANILLVAFSQTLNCEALTGLLQTVGEGMNLLFSIVICCLVVYVVCLSVLMLAGG